MRVRTAGVGSASQQGASGSQMFALQAEEVGDGELIAHRDLCLVDVAPSAALDPLGLGVGATWRELVDTASA